MMETEVPRPAPSRYKTVRRKPATPVVPAASQQQQQQVPEYVAAPMQGRQPQSMVQQQPLSTPLIDQVVQSNEQVRASGGSPQRHQSKFRKMLRLNTKDHPPPSAAQPQTAPPVAQPRRSVKAPERFVQSDQSDEDPEKLRAREEAFLALEGKRRPPRPKKPELVDMRDPGDIEIQLYHDKHGPITTRIHNDTDASALLMKVRPGHDRCLLECWPSLGIQRPVRYFEVVVDVTNTWDLGSPSHLRLGKNVWGESSSRLEDFPKALTGMGGTTFYYFVTADKKWARRTLSLSGGGVLSLARKDKPSYDKDHLQTINLENFDIYSFADTFSPNSKLRCPTKFCFVLKSQHKQSLFGKDSVFAHYFATDDLTLFTHWYAVIRDSKARLIAEKKGLAPWVEAVKEDKISTPLDERLNPFVDSLPSSPARGRAHPKPLLSPEELAQPPPSVAEMQRSKSLHRGKSVRTGRSGRSPSVPVPGQPTGLIGNVHQEVFAPGGLLGSDYEEKKRLAQIRDKEARSREGMLPNNSLSRPSSSGSHQQQHSGIHRSRSVANRPTTAEKNGTLLSFGAGEINSKLPHHAPIPRGRAHTVTEQQHQNAGGLIGFATSPRPGEDAPPPIPNNPILRRPTTAKKHGYVSEDESPFTGTGLLAQSFHSAGAGNTGHGVRLPDSGGPLVDMGPRSVFAPGSLLERRERETGGPARPVIDRDPNSDVNDE